MHKIFISGIFLMLVLQLQGQIHYTEIVQSDLIAADFNDMDFSDVDGDGDLDVVIAGREQDAFRTNLYFNNGNGLFTRSLNTNFPLVFIPSVVFADIDGDGDEDLFISGTDVEDNGHTKLYTNNGNGLFTEFPSDIFPDLLFSYTAAFSDIDNDGDQDLCLIGGRFIAPLHANLYFNDGTGVFSKDTISILQGVSSGTVDFSDIDNDGDQDLLITGRSVDSSTSTKLYENDGTGKFDMLNSSNLEQLGVRSIVAFTDIDGDSDPDFILSGHTEGTSSSPLLTLLYENNGNGVFTETANNSINQLTFNSLSFGDVEGDGDNDLLISGWADNNEFTNLYLNDGAGVFSECLIGAFEPVRRGTAVFEELNGDDKIDIILSGWSSSSPTSRTVKVYKNQNILGSEAELSNSIIKSYSYINGFLNVNLLENYEDIEINIYNILGQALFLQEYKNIDHLQIELQPQVAMRFVMVKVNSKEFGLIRLMN